MKVKAFVLFTIKIIAIVIYCSSVTTVVHSQPIDSVRYYKGKLDTANYKLYMANQQVNAVKFYIKCVQRKPANKKFFWNWITTRAIVPHPSYDASPVTTNK